MKDNTTALLDGSVTIEPGGDLVTALLPDLRARLHDTVETGARRLTIDLGGVRMVDSAGLGLLIATHNSLKRRGGELNVVQASEDILQLFKAVRLHRHFSISGK